jgi:hypothetical protein
MLDEIDRERNLECAGKYGVTTLVLFGSSLENDEAHDIQSRFNDLVESRGVKIYG